MNRSIDLKEAIYNFIISPIDDNTALCYLEAIPSAIHFYSYVKIRRRSMTMVHYETHRFDNYVVIIPLTQGY